MIESGVIGRAKRVPTEIGGICLFRRPSGFILAGVPFDGRRRVAEKVGYILRQAHRMNPSAKTGSNS